VDLAKWRTKELVTLLSNQNSGMRGTRLEFCRSDAPRFSCRIVAVGDRSIEPRTVALNSFGKPSSVGRYASCVQN